MLPYTKWKFETKTIVYNEGMQMKNVNYMYIDTQTVVIIECNVIIRVTIET